MATAPRVRRLAAAVLAGRPFRSPAVRRRVAAAVSATARQDGPALDLAYPAAINVRKPNRRTIEFVASLDPRPAVVAEIGIYRGHTSRELVKLLPEGGQLHLYDFEPAVDWVCGQLRAEGHSNVVGFGNSDRTLDSYNWSLMRMLERHTAPVYDYVLLDGAHTWAVDALAFLLVDRLLKPGGHVDLDDYDWTLDASPVLNPDAFPRTAEWYTDEQIRTRQVELIADLLIRRDPRYVEVVPDKVWRKAEP